MLGFGCHHVSVGMHDGACLAAGGELGGGAGSSVQKAAGGSQLRSGQQRCLQRSGC